MTTALDIITAALGHLGVLDPVESIDPDNGATCLRALQSMLDAWQLDPQAVIGRVELVYTPASGAQSFTIGPDANIDADMPASVDFAFARVGTVDSRIRIGSFDEYLSESAKNITGAAEYIAYERSPDIGTVYLYPASNGAELHLWVRRDAVEGFSSIESGTALTLPNGYRNALEWCLADEVSATFKALPDAAAKAALMAARARRRVKRANLRLGALRMPDGIVNPTGLGSTVGGGVGSGDGYFASDYVQ